MPNENITVTDLRTALSNLDALYNGVYQTPEAINTLRKTFQSFNITIQDWNSVLLYLENHSLILAGLVNMDVTLVEAIAYVQSQIDNIHIDITDELNAGLATKQNTLVSGTNIKTVNNQSLLGSGNINIEVPAELFYCTPGTTTFAEVTAALSDGKLPVCIYNNISYSLSSYSSSVYRFSTAQSDSVKYLTVNDSNSWATSSYSFELAINKVTSISSGSTDTQYPSAKAVYSSLENVVEIAEGKTKNYVISNATTGTGLVNTSFNSTNTSITLTISGNSIQDVNGNEIELSELNIGDIVSITDTGVPDRWVTSISSGNISFGVLEIKLSIDTTVTQNSANPVSSGAVYTALGTKQDTLPTVVNDRYLHTNATTGALEWTTVTSAPIYTAGTGITISSTTISVDSSVVALQTDLPSGEIDINFNDFVTTATTGGLSNIVIGNSTDGYTRYNITTTSASASSGGSTLSLVTTGEKYTWNNKQNALTTSSVSSGTPTQVIGFNSSNNLVRGTYSAGMSNPMTTSGDIIVGGSSGTPTRLAKGTAGQVLKVGSSGLEWANESGGSGIPTMTIALSQVVSQDPLRILLTAEQTIMWSNNKTIYFDLTALNLPNGIGIEDAGDDGFVLPGYFGGGVDAIVSFSSWYDLEYTQFYVTVSVGTISSVQTNQAPAPSGHLLKSDGNGSTTWSSALPIITTAPSAANTDGIIICVLNSEPATKYDGYLYIITSSNSNTGGGSND